VIVESEWDWDVKMMRVVGREGVSMFMLIFVPGHHLSIYK
jgi:hypothetical protein